MKVSRLFVLILIGIFVVCASAEAGPREAIEAVKNAIQEETAAREAADQDLQDQITNIELIPGPEGPQGPPGEDSGLSAYSKETTLDPGWVTNAVMECPDGTFAVGGSCWFDKDPIDNSTEVIHDGPWYGHESWNCYVSNSIGTETIVVRTSTICKELP